MIRPFIFVHPPEQHVQQLNQQLLFQRVLLPVLFQLPHYLVTYINYIDWFVRLPIVRLVFVFDEESDVIHETIQHLLILLPTLHYL